MKKLIEKRNTLVEEMEGILEDAKKETRAFTEDENTKIVELKKEIENIDNTIKTEKEMRGYEKMETKKEDKQLNKEEIETRDFASFIRENRADTNMTKGTNGAIIPESIANKIITEVKDICPILQRATIYNAKGTLKIPTYGNDGSKDITVGYQTEFTEIESNAGKFGSIDLSGYLAGALTLVSKSLLNNSDINLVNFVVSQMSQKIAEFIEHELLIGSGSSACTGITVGCTNIVKTASATAITADELITLQSTVKQAFQNNACWIMNADTFTSMKKLKDANNRYLLQDDITGEFPYRLLGKPVFISDNMPTMAAGNKTVIYGDMSGLSVKFVEQMEIQILLEKYATQHAIGVIAWMELDSKVTDNKRMAVLQQKTA